jgi:hypothetical protein
MLGVVAVVQTALVLLPALVVLVAVETVKLAQQVVEMPALVQQTLEVVAVGTLDNKPHLLLEVLGPVAQVS